MVSVNRRLQAACLLVPILVACLALPARAQFSGSRSRPPVDTKEVAEKLLKSLAAAIEAGPARGELEIKRLPAQPVKLFKADPKLLENKFVATFQLSSARWSNEVREASSFGTSPQSFIRELPKELSELVGAGLLPVADFFRVSDRVYRLPLQERWQMLAEQCPEDRRPPAAPLKFLASEEAQRDVRLSNSGDRAVHFELFAPTAEEAEARARAILTLIDGGICLPLQKYCLETSQAALQSAEKATEAMLDTENLLAAETAKLAKPSEISEDILSKLKAEKVLTEIELAGLAARIKGCEAQLAADKEHTPATAQGIKDLKLRAEIDQLGLKEKLSQIQRLIAEGDQREATKNRSVTLQNELRLARGQKIAPLQRRAAEVALLALTYFSPPAVAENQINIAPVEWK